MSTVLDLIKRSQQKDLVAFESLVELYEDRLYTQCVHLTHDPHEAQDLAQEVFVKAYKGIGSFRSEADFGTWLHRIAVNTWINQQKKNKISIAFSLDETVDTDDGEVRRELAASTDTPLEEVLYKEERAVIDTALNKIGLEFRTALILRELEGYSYEDIARMLDCSLGTVKSRINRGRKALKDELNHLLKQE